MYRLDEGVRMRLANLLDRHAPGEDWIALTEWLDMGILIDNLKLADHPTLRLLDNFEVSLM